jgi:D-glycero-D-manno-heptose 1,7-bisphosphate phosphatase
MGIDGAPMKRAIFLDRDGVLNRAIVRDGRPYPPRNVAELEILPGVELALRKLQTAGFLLIVVTNQPDVARGATTREDVEKINAALGSLLPIDEFRTCYHDGEAECDCRKPKPGALLAAAALHDIDLSRSYMVGDRWRDTEAGRRAGCKTIFVDYGYRERQPVAVDYRVASLSEAAEVIFGVTSG